MGRVLSVVFAVGLLGMAVGLAACGCTAPNAQQGAGDSDYSGTSESRAALVCKDLVQAKCDLLVRCKAPGATGVAMTDAECNAGLTTNTQTCEMNHASAIQAVPDGDFNACVDSLYDISCALVCDGVHQNPSSCMGLAAYDPMNAVTSCTL